jgi:hypothetical protein
VVGCQNGSRSARGLFLLCPPALLATLFHRFHIGRTAFSIRSVVLQCAASIVVVHWVPDATISKPQDTERGSHDLSQGVGTHPRSCTLGATSSIRSRRERCIKA